VTFDEAVDAMWKKLPGYSFVVSSSKDCLAFRASIQSPDFKAVQWTAGDRTQWDVISGRDASSGWCETPAEAISDAVEILLANMDDAQNAVRVAKQATGETE
jgi:hypothetical protein